MTNPLDLSDRHIVVTGASSGIGRATAVLAANLGARLTLSGRNMDRLAEARAEMAGNGHRLAPHDLADTDGIENWLDGIVRDGGPIDGIAHVGGIQVTMPLRSVKMSFVEEMLRVNLISAFAIAKGFRKRGNHGPEASLVLVASSAALRGAPGNTVYAASKGGIVSMTKGLGLELLRDGIRVNCVAPALTQTAIAENFRALSEASYQQVVGAHPMGIGAPEDVANAIAFLLADTTKWISGSTLSVDGGFLA